MSDPNVTPLLRYFFPAEILKSLQLTSNNECTIPDIRAKLYINSNGSIDDLLKFKSFPGSVNKFHRNMADPYMMDTYMYYGMNDANKPFFYKHDLLVYFEQFVFRRIRQLPFIIPAISFYFKCKEDELGSGRFELAPLNTDAIEKIEEQIERSIEKLHKHDKAIIREPFPEFSYEQFCARITRINFIDSSDLGPLPKILSENQAELSSDANKKLYPNIIIWIHTIVTVFNSITESHPELFRPSSVSRKPDDPVIIRCFEDDHKLYMMDFEFVLAKTPLVVSHQLKPIEDMKDAIKRSGVYETVFANQLKARLTKNREYVRHPILRTNRRAVPIPTFDGRHCILASDLLFEILRDMCSVQNVFQKINTKNWSIINNLFKDLAGTFNGKLGPFFIDTENSEAVRKKCVTHIEHHLGPQLKEVKFIKEFNGFVLKDVKSTIKFLGLTTAFPKISDFAEHAFKTVKQRKGDKKLDTRDMFTALEICQLNCILPILPKLQKFVHNQGACLRNHLHCAKCLQAHPEPLAEPTLFKWVTAETPGATVVARKCDAPDPEGFSESSESELPAELLAELKAKYPEHFPAADVEQVENEEKELQEESNETSPESREEEPEKEESLEESSEEPSEKPVESILNKHSASCPNSSSQASTEEDKENIPASNPQEEGSSDCEQCENLRKFRDAMKELIGNCMSGTTEILKETRKDHKELENSLKSYGPIRLSDDNRELFDKQFERIMKRSDWDITNCGDDIRPWPWFRK
ncbi:hypothetical protein L5515_006677 [Caenorhabditis briggsae]|uniref:DUF7809 domain-containing protein n=2 Tax=Caenorhabditis briggsae TaxID=6238 RepID=A0AAE9F353_CAEBR|nr:hypothetical protein L5515_006677 [Caenorhabditis briggsae]